MPEFAEGRSAGAIFWPQLGVASRFLNSLQQVEYE
jgi:hypothetical protein